MSGIRRLGLLVFLVCASCGHELQVKNAPAASRPSAMEEPAIVQLHPIEESPNFRLTNYKVDLLVCQQKYLRGEGFAHRGPLFHILISRIEELRLITHVKINQFDLLVLLGPPDYAACGDKGVTYVYLVDGRGKSDCVIVDLDEAGLLEAIGWSDAKGMDFRTSARARHWPDDDESIPGSAASATTRKSLAVPMTSGAVNLLVLQQKYLEKEGFDHRREEFLNLTKAVGQSGVDPTKPRVTQFDVLALLGPPDFCISTELGPQYGFGFTGPNKNICEFTIALLEVGPWASWNMRAGDDPRLAAQGNPDNRWPDNDPSLTGISAGLAANLEELPSDSPPLGDGYLGIEVEAEASATQPAAEQHAANHPLLIKRISLGCPASRHGMRVGDRVISLTCRGQIVHDLVASNFMNRISHLRPGEQVMLTIERTDKSGHPMRLSFSLAAGSRSSLDPE